MTIEFFQARLKTAGKTADEINEDYEGSKLYEEEVQRLIAAYDSIDGLEVLVMKSIFTEDYSLSSWKSEDDEKIRDFVYEAEQDPLFGTYIDEREEFIKDWAEGDYSPTGMLVFKVTEVEIIKTI